MRLRLVPVTILSRSPPEPPDRRAPPPGNHTSRRRSSRLQQPAVTWQQSGRAFRRPSQRPGRIRAFRFAVCRSFLPPSPSIASIIFFSPVALPLKAVSGNSGRLVFTCKICCPVIPRTAFNSFVTLPQAPILPHVISSTDGSSHSLDVTLNPERPQPDHEWYLLHKQVLLHQHTFSKASDGRRFIHLHWLC